jgi:hypothetical protein
MMKNIEDRDLQRALSTLPSQIIDADLKAYKASIKESSWASDVGKGIQSTMKRVSMGMGDQAPMAALQYQINQLRDILDRADNATGLAAKLAPKLTPERRAEIQSRIADLVSRQKVQLDEAAGTQKEVDALNNSRSIGQVDRERETAEDKAKYQEMLGDELGGFVGTGVNAIANPSTGFQLAAETLPTAVPVIGASLVGGVAGGLAGGPAGAAAGATLGGITAGSAMTAQDAMSSSIDQVNQLTPEELATLEPYQKLIASGASPQQAKDELAIRAGLDAAGMGAILGAVTGGLGAEVGLGKLLTGIFTKQMGPQAAKSFLGSLATKLPTLGRELAVEGIEEGGTQLVANVAQNAQVGTDTSIFKDVGESAAQGIIASGPISGTTAALGAYNGQSQPATAGADPGAGGAATAQPGTNAGAGAPVQPAPAQTPTGGLADEGSLTIPEAQDTTGQADTTAPEVSPQSQPVGADPATDALSALTELRQIFDEVNKKAGEPLTYAESNALIDAMIAAEDKGAPFEVISKGLDGVKRHVAPGSSYYGLRNGYEIRRAARAAPAVDEMASAIVTNEGKIDGTVETVTAADEGSTPAVADINSAMETPATAVESTAAPVPKTAKPGRGKPKSPRAGRVKSDSAPTDGGIAQTVETVGTNTDIEGTDSRPDNQPVSGENGAVGVSERSQSDAAGSQPADGGSTVSTTDGTPGSNLSVGEPITWKMPRLGMNFTGKVTSIDPIKGTFNTITSDGITFNDLPIDSINAGAHLSAGQGVTYKGTYRGAKAMTGTVTAVHPDGSFNMTVKGSKQTSTYKNLPASGIVKDTTKKGGAKEVDATPSEAQGVTDNTPSEVDTAPAEAATGPVTLTPSGYEPAQLLIRADKLADSDSQHAFSGMELVDALENGDYAKADEMAQYLYERGLRQFKPPQENTGRAERTVNDVFLRVLSPAERMALQSEYSDTVASLPPELSSFAAFRDTAVQDQLLVDAGEAPNSTILGRMSEVARKIIRKLASALAMVMVALTINTMVPINDATAAVGHGTVQTVQQVQGLSPAANTVNAWIQSSKDNKGKAYLIADKQSGEIHIVSPNGTIEATAPALYGRTIGDSKVFGETPAGIFTVQQTSAPASYGGDIQQFATAADGSIYAVHRVLTNNKQNRIERLATPTAADNRISLGCINIPADLYNKYLSGKFEGKLYVLPDQRSLGEVFQGIQEQKAQQELMPDRTMPENLSMETNTEFESSTANVARMAPKNETLADATMMASQSLDPMLATTMMAAMGNDPADGQLFYAMGIPIFGALAARRRAKKRGVGGQATIDDAVNNPVRDLTEEQYSQIMSEDDLASDINPVVSRSGRERAVAIQQWVQRTASSVSDTQTSFIDWADKAVGRRADQDMDTYAAWRALRLQKGIQHNLETQLYDQFMRPLDNLAREAAVEKGIEADTTARHLGTWLAVQHIPESNAAIRKAITNELYDVMLTGTPEQITKAQENLGAFDQAQAGTITSADLKKATVEYGADGKIIKPGYGLAGGKTDAWALSAKRSIEQYYNKPDLFTALETQRGHAVNGMLDFRVAHGTLEPNEADALRSMFKHYVPLYVTKEPNETGGDIYVGTNSFNPAGDHVRRGSSRSADHAFISLRKQLFRTAAGVSSQMFKREIHQLYEAQRPAGLERVNMASHLISQEARDATGLIYRDGDKTFKYYWTDPAVVAGIMFQHAEPKWPGAGLLKTYTGIRGRLNTVFRPSFWGINWVRDAVSRTVSATARNLVDSRGNEVSALRTAAMMKASLFNPVAISDLTAFMHFGKRENSPYVQAYKELKQLGGVSTYADMVRRGVGGYRDELVRGKSMQALNKGLEKVYTTHDAFSMAPAVMQYIGLKNLDIEPQRAAFIVRDDFDAAIKSRHHNTLATFYPFVGAAANSAKNIIGRLTTKRGAKVFSAYTAVAISLYSLAAALSGDEDDGTSWLDSISLVELSNSIPLRYGDGRAAIKIPVAFEVPRLAWTLGASLHRLARGTAEPSEVMQAMAHATLRELQPFGLESVGGGDSIIKDLVIAMTPDGFRWATEVAMNQTSLGGMVHSQAQRGQPHSDAGQARTQNVWKDMASDIRKYTGLDFFPESVRHTVTQFMTGGLGALTTAMESESLYMASGELSTRQELGPAGVALGINSVWDNGNRYAVNNYYRNQEKVTKLLTQHGVTWGEEGTKPGEGATALYARMLDAGASVNEAELVMRAKESETELDKEKKLLAADVKYYKAAEIDPSTAQPAYEQFNRNRRNIMERFNQDYRRLK